MNHFTKPTRHELIFVAGAPEQKLFACAITARNPSKGGSMVKSCAVMARSVEEAVGKGVAIARESFKPEDGYSDHQANVQMVMLGDVPLTDYQIAMPVKP